MIHVMTEEDYNGASAAAIGDILRAGKVIVLVSCVFQEEVFGLEQLSRVSSLDKVVNVQGE